MAYLLVLENLYIIIIIFFLINILLNPITVFTALLTSESGERAGS